jgi:flagellin-like hook-associated protein FlgL
VTALEIDVASVDTQIASAKATLGYYSQRLESQQKSLAKTQDFIKNIE